MNTCRRCDRSNSASSDRKRGLTIPKPTVNATGLHLDADDNVPAELIKTMFDLIYLAFQTDSTRVATYQLGNMNERHVDRRQVSTVAGLWKQHARSGTRME